MNSYSVFTVFLLAVAGNGAAAQTSDSLWHYTEVAVRDNPGIKAAYHAYRSALGSIPAAGALDDPLLEVGVFPRPLEYVDGKEVARLQVMQMFPWFGTRAAARAEASAMARMTLEEYRESVYRLRGEVATSWYALCLLRQRQVTNNEQRQLL